MRFGGIPLRLVRAETILSSKARRVVRPLSPASAAGGCVENASCRIVASQSDSGLTSHHVRNNMDFLLL